MSEQGELKRLSEEITRWYEDETGLSVSSGKGGRGPGAGRFLDLLVWLEQAGLLKVSGIEHSITECSIVLRSDEAWNMRKTKRTKRELASLQLGASFVVVDVKKCRRWVYIVPPEAPS